MKGAVVRTLSWHHFDPPWAVEQHHRPEGMIALCRDHHPEADSGAFTADHLRELKQKGRDQNEPLHGQFNWMRESLLAVVGGSFYFEVPVAVEIGDTPIIWFSRDADQRLLVSINQPSVTGLPRMQMVENYWITAGSDEVEIVCPPSGKLLHAKYPNGDEVKVQFRELLSLDDLDRIYPAPGLPKDVLKQFEDAGIEPPDMRRSHGEAVERAGITFPIAAVEITMEVAGAGLSFSPRGTAVGTNQIIGGWMVRCGVGIHFG